jgi:aminoglycoside phosphotransferase (APT) family kinase protein
MTTIGTRIGDGRTAEIYTWGDHQVIKLFRADLPLDWVDYEARIAQIVIEAGISAPAFDGVVEINGRRGIVYEYIQGTSMRTQMQQQPWLMIQFAQQFAEVHATMHQRSAPALPSQHERIETGIRQAPRLSAALKKRLLKRLETLPDGDSVCHGDFHPDNVLMSPRGLLVIDWTDAKRGIPAADLARTRLLLRESALPSSLSTAERLLFNVFRRIFYKAYWKSYTRLRPTSRESVQAWIPLQAAARLNESIDEEEDHLVQLAGKID